MHKSTFAVLLLVLLHLFAARANAQGWVDVSDPNNTPGGTNRAAMCFDEARGYTLLVRGDETWTYDGVTWTQLTPPTPPSVLGVISSHNTNNVIESCLTYDPIRQVCVLGHSFHYYITPHWRVGVVLYEWDGQDWTIGPTLDHFDKNYSQLSPHVMTLAHDSISGSVIVLTRSAGCQAGCNQTGLRVWRYDANGLTSLTALVNPVVNTHAQFHAAWNDARQRVALVVSDPPSMWEFNGATNNWTQCFPSYLGHPITSGDFGPIAFSDTNNVGIGLGVDLPYTTRTLEYSGCEIGIQFLPTQPAVRLGYSIAYDSSRSRFVLHGGSGYADTWELELGPLASYTTTGTGCAGTGGTPTLQAANGSLPVAGSQFNVQVSGMPWNTPAFMFMGTSNTSYGGAPLPFDLAPIGAPGCILRAPGTFLFGVPNVLGTGLWNYSIPYLPGQVFYNQAIIFDPAANSLGLTVSNVGEAVIGS